MKYFINFVEEAIFNEEYKEYTTGRVEIYIEEEQYAIEEIRFLSKEKDFYKFRDKWDFKDINEKQLKELKKIIKDKYKDKI